MAGEAKTAAFNLGTATVMIGAQEDMFDLTVEDHSIGLVKNFSCGSTPTETKLTQGTTNNVVYSVLTDVAVETTMEVYEYTAKNLAYALGLEATQYDATYTPHVLKTSVVGDGVTTDTIVLTALTDISSSYPAGAWVLIQGVSTKDYDKVFAAKVVSATYNATYSELTVEMDKAIPTGVTFYADDRVIRQSLIPVGSKEPREFYSAKVVGILPEENRPVTLLFPKIKITQGFNLNFSTDGFSNMPFMFDVYDQISTDPFYAAHKNDGFVLMLR